MTKDNIKAVVVRDIDDTSFELHILAHVPTEYFCCSCKQLCLSCRTDKTKCGNCGSKDIIVGRIGTLDKEKLIANCKTD